jgi:16S rRNA (guanine527-N7)-methyltransferase
MVEVLSLPATVHHARAESLKLTVDMVTARACAPLSKLLGFAKPYYDKGATGLFLKSADAAAEIDEARKTWTFRADILTSRSDPRGRVLRIERLVRAAKS